MPAVEKQDRSMRNRLDQERGACGSNRVGLLGRSETCREHRGQYRYGNSRCHAASSDVHH